MNLWEQILIFGFKDDGTTTHWSFLWEFCLWTESRHRQGSFWSLVPKLSITSSQPSVPRRTSSERRGLSSASALRSILSVYSLVEPAPTIRYNERENNNGDGWIFQEENLALLWQRIMDKIPLPNYQHSSFLVFAWLNNQGVRMWACNMLVFHL